MINERLTYAALLGAITCLADALMDFNTDHSAKRWAVVVACKKQVWRLLLIYSKHHSLIEAGTSGVMIANAQRSIFKYDLGVE